MQPGGQDRNYGAYGDRQLTAEEEEEEDITATKQEIKFMKQQDVSSTRNALQAAAQAEAVGRDTLARLGTQGERLHNTDRNLDLAGNHQRIAEEKAKELKIANRGRYSICSASQTAVLDEQAMTATSQIPNNPKPHLTFCVLSY
jgi:protein transport protein SEC9